MAKIQNHNPIVMVDDNSDEIFIAKTCFSRSKLNNRFLSFTEGEKFLDYLAQVDAGLAPMPAAVLLDINMPMLNGFEVLVSIRRNALFSDLPILVITNSSDERDEKKSMAFGANGFQLKPQSAREYIDLFDSLDRSN